MKTIHLIVFCLMANTLNAQNSITFKNGLVVKGKITEVTSEQITIQLDSTNKKSFSTENVKKYYDGKNTIGGSSLKASKVYDASNATPGDELIKASNSYYAGMIVSTVGVLTSSIGSYVYALSGKTDNDTQKGIVYAGGAIALVGVIMNLSAFSHVAKAGRKFNAISSKDGLGLSMKF